VSFDNAERPTSATPRTQIASMNQAADLYFAIKFIPGLIGERNSEVP